MKNNNWKDIHLILNNRGQVIGDYQPSDEPYGFLRDGKAFTLDDAIEEEKGMLVNLVYLFFTSGNIEYRNDFEYIELEGYTIYRKVEKSCLYKNLFFNPQKVMEDHFLYLTVVDDSEEYFLMTTVDQGFAYAVKSHFSKEYGVSVDIEDIVAQTPKELDYWRNSVLGSL